MDEKRYCLYARKSMEAEERQALSIDSQIHEMQTIAERDELHIVAIKSESHSAKNSGQRNVFTQMIQGIRSGEYNAILTWNPDRLSRNAGDLGLLVDLMDQGLLKEIRTYGQIFSASPNDKFLLMILCSQAKLENDNKGENVKRGLRARIEMGLWPTMAPLGYLNSNLKDKLCIKDVDPDRAPMVKKMFEKVAYEGYSCHEVLRWLHKIDFRSPRGKHLSLSMVQNVLKRTFYYGEFEFPKNSGHWYKGSHTPIITKKLYDRVQERISQAYHQKKHTSALDSFAFTKLLRCGSCGSGVTAEEKYKKLKSGETAVYRYYMCTRGKNRWCRELYINEADVVNQVVNLFDHVEIDLIGTRSELETEIEKWYRLHAFITGNPVPERPIEKREYDLREYAKSILREGTVMEQRNILKHLTSRFALKNKRIYLDSIPASDDIQS